MKFKVEWTNTVTYTCSHVIEADSEEEAIAKVSAMDSDQWDMRDESDNVDENIEVELKED